jgi:hypothetical protein
LLWNLGSFNYYRWWRQIAKVKMAGTARSLLISLFYGASALTANLMNKTIF